MSELICQDANGIVWVKNADGEIFGIVSSIEILDCDGLKYDQDTLTVLDLSGFNVNQDWESETTYIDFIECNGEVSRLIFNNSSVTVIEAND